jgi:hypothetical protein
MSPFRATTRNQRVGACQRVISPIGGRGANASRNLDAHVVVDGMAKLLLTAEVSLCRLDRGVAEKKLNLVQFPSGYVTQPGARSP